LPRADRTHAAEQIKGAQRLKDRRGESKASQDEDDSFIERAQGKKSIANWFRALSCYLISNRFSLVQSVENDLKGGSPAEKFAAKREKAFAKVQDIGEACRPSSASEFEALEQQRNELEASVSELSDLVDTLLPSSKAVLHSITLTPSVDSIEAGKDWSRN
jgi:hypothetical protein